MGAVGFQATFSVKKSLAFEPSLPSAEYALPLSTGCMGHCHYCYLQTTMGNRPYVRVYVNLDDIFHAAEKYINPTLARHHPFRSGLYLQPGGNRTSPGR